MYMFATRLHFPCFNCEDQWEDSSPLMQKVEVTVSLLGMLR